MRRFVSGSRSRRNAQWVGLVSFLALTSLAAASACAAARSNAAPASARPSAPAHVIVVPGAASATVHWSSPASHGAKVTRYRVTTYAGHTVAATKVVGAITHTHIGGLKNATRYAVTVVAINARGAGPARTSAPVTVGAPIAPIRPGARAVSGGMRVSWHAPAANNGAAVTGYVVAPYQSGVALPAHRFNSPATTQVLTGLPAGYAYQFKVAATNARGSGPRSKPSGKKTVACPGVKMTRGQADIDTHATGTVFCLSGTHDWTLTPRSGDRLLGPAVLDGRHSRHFAIDAQQANNVTLVGLEIRNYTVGSQQGAIFVPGHQSSGWVLRSLHVHDNGTSAGGAGANLGRHWSVIGGRYYNNRQEGLGGSGAGTVVNGVELDHNNFTNDTYRTRNVECGFEAGGFKWVANNVTVKHSNIHDNACKGLWSDINSHGMTITDNQVYRNWNEGIFIEISSGARVLRNHVRANGFHTNGNGCAWLWGGGITLASSSDSEIAFNTLSGNCNGITGTQQNRPGAKPGLLQNVKVHDNKVAGPGGKTGAAADNGANLSTRRLQFVNNAFTKGMDFCQARC
jgi:parallel beta-helix repeat protein